MPLAKLINGMRIMSLDIGHTNKYDTFIQGQLYYEAREGHVCVYRPTENIIQEKESL